MWDRDHNAATLARGDHLRPVALASHRTSAVMRLHQRPCGARGEPTIRARSTGLDDGAGSPEGFHIGDGAGDHGCYGRFMDAGALR